MAVTALNKLRRLGVVDNLASAAAHRKAGFIAYARKAVAWARFDRQCAARNGWKLP